MKPTPTAQPTLEGLGTPLPKSPAVPKKSMMGLLKSKVIGDSATKTPKGQPLQ